MSKSDDETPFFLNIDIDNYDGTRVAEVKCRTFGVDFGDNKIHVVSCIVKGDKIIVETSRRFKGWIDQVKIYNQMIKQIEIANMESVDDKERVVFT